MLLRNEFIVRPDHVATIDLEDWVKRKDDENSILVDVRPRLEYESGHLEYDISVPINELHEYIEGIPKDKEIIAYCRGAYCIYATEAVEILQSKGYKAFRLEAGIHEWNQFQDFTYRVLQ